MKLHSSIKSRLMTSVLLLITLIILGLTLVTYQQNRSSQIEKLVTQAQAIISPFHELLRDELPEHVKNQILYLNVALRAKESTQLPELFKAYQSLIGIGFYSKDNVMMLNHGNIIEQAIPKQVVTISKNRIQILLPFEKNGVLIGNSLLTFSSHDFQKEQSQILSNGVLFLVIFLFIGLVGAKWVGQSIAGPIELLAKHIQTNQLEHIPLLERNDELGAFSHAIHDLSITLKQREDELKNLAFFDSLTGLPNRELFLDRLNQMLFLADREISNLAILFIDFNGFKNVNDTYGHAAGDELLRQIAQRMLLEKRKTDVLARISGDEFTLALYQPKTKQLVSDYCENLIKMIEEPFLILENEIFISASIGISFYPTNGTSAEVLINNADRAMYHSKTFGGSQYRFYEKDLHYNNQQRRALESDLWRAIENNEIELHYQARISLSDGKLRGIEALARWNHPTQGMISPLEFIILAEQTGLIKPLGQLIMRKAILQMKEWLDQGLEKDLNKVKMAINLSALQLTDRELLTTINTLLDQTELPADRLEFELTETAVMRQAEQGMTIINAIHDLGIEIAIDDFGTGYSSLSRLQEFPIDTLKIDRSFVKDICLNENNLSIVKAIISLAHSLGFNTIAEGVEEKEQAELLLSIGANEAQGYYYSRPLTAQAFSEYRGLDNEQDSLVSIKQ